MLHSLLITEALILQTKLSGEVNHMHKGLQHQDFFFFHKWAKLKRALFKWQRHYQHQFLIRTSLFIHSVQYGVTCLAWPVMHEPEGGKNPFTFYSQPSFKTTQAAASAAKWAIFQTQKSATNQSVNGDFFLLFITVQLGLQHPLASQTHRFLSLSLNI